MNARILCVESSPDERAMIAEVLHQYDVTCAASAHEAARTIERGAFDLYILDYRPSDSSGVRLCRDIRERDPRVPIVFCSAAARSEDRADAMSAGASAFLLKPIDTAELLRKVRVYTELVDLEGRRAKLAEEHAVNDELRESAERLRSATALARERASGAIEKMARARAFRAFVENGGTRANFDRWWPQVFRERFEAAWPSDAIGMRATPADEGERRAGR